MKERSKNIITVLFSIIVIGLLSAGFALAFILGYNPARPNPVEIIDDGNSVYMYADVNDNYRAYRFKFSNAEKGDLVLESTKNLMTNYDMFRSGIEIGVEYSISVCYVSEDNLQNSQYSEPIIWKTYAYLASPVILSDDVRNIIYWEAVENADFYEVHYNYQSEEKIITTTETELNLQAIEGGERDFYVVAKSNSESYKSSLKSNNLELSVIHEIPNFSTIALEIVGESKILNLTSTEAIQKMIVFINTEQHQINANPVLENGIYAYAVDITAIYVENVTIGVRPATVDTYNVYTSGEILVL